MPRTAWLIALLVTAAARPAAAQEPLPRLVLLDTAVLPSRIDESSGIVESRRHPGLYWTHNDSGDRAWLYATDSTGADLGRVMVEGARNEDWEDLAIGDCPRSTEPCLYIGDIGDNNAHRGKIRIYIVREPEPPHRGDSTTAPLQATIELRYPDHPHDAEGLAVQGDTLWLVTKDRTGPAVLFRAGAAGPPAQTLERIGPLGMETSFFRGRVATGAAITGGGRILAVRTYVSIHFFDVTRGFRPLTRPAGIGIPVIESQGEGIAFDHLGRILLSSEGGTTHHAIIARLRLEGLAL